MFIVMSGRQRGGHQFAPPFKIRQFADDGVLFTAGILPTFKIPFLVYIWCQQMWDWCDLTEVMYWIERKINPT